MSCGLSSAAHWELYLPRWLLCCFCYVNDSGPFVQDPLTVTSILDQSAMDKILDVQNKHCNCNRDLPLTWNMSQLQCAADIVERNKHVSRSRWKTIFFAGLSDIQVVSWWQGWLVRRCASVTLVCLAMEMWLDQSDCGSFRVRVFCNTLLNTVSWKSCFQNHIFTCSKSFFLTVSAGGNESQK